ncbi:MAG: hypothetical protein RBU37_23615 [Myxococcota bacterium]|jgi:hypothetical protein|nr:hypothetical protein [Myxococcota bacterium]
MGDFLRAEWKTILSVALILGGLFWFFFTEQRVAPRGSSAEQDPGFEEGRRLGALQLGMSSDALRTLAGEPSRVEKLELGLQAWHYDADGLIAYLHADALTAVQYGFDDALSPAREALGLPARNALRGTWNRGEKRKQVLRLERNEENWTRYPGLIAVQAKEAKQPHALLIVQDPELPLPSDPR